MFGQTLIASLHYSAINCCRALFGRTEHASSLPGQPQRLEELMALLLGVMAQTAPQLCCQPCWQCPSSQGGVLSSHGVFSSAGFQSLKNHIENVGQGEDQFSLISCVLGKRGLEKNVSTVFSNILYSCFQCISQKEAVSCEKYITLSSYRGKK